MGIESDKLVLDYLSRVGDLAQQRQLPSGARMRLVTELRGEIDRRRAKADSPAAVRRILARLGTPEDVVSGAAARGAAASGAETGGAGTGGAAASGTDSGRPAPAASGDVPAEAPASVPAPRVREPVDPPKGLRRMLPRPRTAEAADAPPAPREPSPPHLASTEELGSGGRPDWWRVEGGPFGPMDGVPGFVGGVEIPELLEPPPATEAETDAGAGTQKTDAAAGKGTAKAKEKTKKEKTKKGKGGAGAEPVPVVEGVAAAPEKRRRLLGPSGAGGWSNPLLLLAAALLVGGAVMGNLLPLALGWIIAWASRRLTPAESKWAVVVLPGLALAAGMAWLWGRSTERWGEPITQGHMGDAIAETWPWVIRGAAALSAVYLVWRSQRRR
ncbi:HAAS signaling domain-containing protein [Streptomyces cavernae]|uniref:HAAS signaling domain-containing protein n=1 Tax=Streptomyces cavernae TaxID=2259034 RepID=UPI000FEB818C|nr:hypothetical protein [Streptomyces cavernae]